jgi:hypothetical protein
MQEEIQKKKRGEGRGKKEEGNRE